MTEVLIYWRDYRPNTEGAFVAGCLFRWHSNARLLADLVAGDRLWLVTAGKNLDEHRKDAPQVGFLVGIWQVRRVVTNPDDDPQYPSGRYRFRLVADETASLVLDEPVAVDHIVRPAGRDRVAPIGKYLQGPRKLKDNRVRLLRAAAGPQMARQYLSGRQS